MVHGHLFRFDTRIYLETFGPEGSCVGAIVGKNPGSATPTGLDQLLPLNLGRDKMLPTVGARFADGFVRAGRRCPPNAFIRVWNLFYVCNANLQEAKKVAETLGTWLECPSEREDSPIVWFGWGGDDPSLNPLKRRFIGRPHSKAFYFDQEAGEIAARLPTERAFARHTQGLLAAPVIEHLAKLLS